MKKETLTIDHLYKYEVEEILEGGMGYVLLMSMQAGSGTSTFTEGLLETSTMLQDHFRYPYRKQLAGKTVKDEKAMRHFARECHVWLGFRQSGIVPLLKVVKIGETMLALMPRYQGNLRTLLQNKTFSAVQLLKALYEPILSLSTLHTQSGIVHQDIKPENFLYEQAGERCSLFLSDWGIANVTADLLAQHPSEFSRVALESVGGLGTEPYMAPERFTHYRSDITADIFSLGILFFEILTGSWPYHTQRPIFEQIISGEYFERALHFLSGYGEKKAGHLILAMLHPVQQQRISDYQEILTFITSL